jgi:hypothetical protein
MLIPISWIEAVLTSVRLYLIVVLSCISLIIGDLQCLFIYLLAISLSSWDNFLSRSFAHFLIRKKIHDTHFFQCVSCFFCFFIISFAIKKTFEVVSLICLSFFVCDFHVLPKRILFKPKLKSFPLMFSSRNFTVSSLMFRFLIHLSPFLGKV